MSVSHDNLVNLNEISLMSKGKNLQTHHTLSVTFYLKILFHEQVIKLDCFFVMSEK